MDRPLPIILPLIALLGAAAPAHDQQATVKKLAEWVKTAKDDVVFTEPAAGSTALKVPRETALKLLSIDLAAFDPKAVLDDPAADADKRAQAEAALQRLEAERAQLYKGLEVVQAPSDRLTVSADSCPSPCCFWRYYYGRGNVCVCAICSIGPDQAPAKGRTLWNAVWQGDFDAALALAKEQGPYTALAIELQHFVDAGQQIKKNNIPGARAHFRKAESNAKLGKFASYWVCKTYRLEHRGREADACFGKAGLTEDVQPVAAE